jgi:hypothetical protein
MFNTLTALVAIVSIVTKPAVMAVSVVPISILASHSFSLEDRYDNKFVNDVFKDNILLTLNYMSGFVKSKADIDWNKVESPFQYKFTLEPGQEFAFHDQALPDYSKNIIQTTNAHFNWNEGFKYDGDLTGDGVCHLASLIYWTAHDAGLTTYAPSNHNFAVIPDVPKEYGVAIQSPMPSGNLYIINNFDKPVTFIFDYDGEKLKVSVTESD